MKKSLGFVLKLFISCILLLYLFYFSGIVDIQEVIKTLKQTQISIFILVFFICAVNVLITTKRWSLFLPKDIKYTRLVSLCFIGYFFNTFLPGRVGGDIVKTFYLYRDIGKAVTSIVSVFIDRYMGFCAMIVVSFAAFLGGYSYLKDTKIELLIPIICSIFLMANFVLWKVNWGKIKGISSYYTALMEYKAKKRIIFGGLLLSLIIQSISILEVYLISIAMGITVPVIYFFIFVPIINAICAIPITIAGLGVREVGFAALFNMFFTQLGVTPHEAVSISLLTFTAMVLVNLIGGVEYLRIKELTEE